MTIANRAASVAVIGAGWAGLSCAHHLTQRGARVTLYDAAPSPGGRARDAQVNLNGQALTLDNGQHMLIGAYQHTLALIDRYSNSDSLMRLPMQFESADLSVRRRGPGRPGLIWGFTYARGLNIGSRLALARLIVHLARRRWHGFAGANVAQLLRDTGQTPTLVDKLWRPLVVAAMNTHLETACAQTFVNVIHDAFFLSGTGSDFIVSTLPLGQLLPEPMLARLVEDGLQWRPGSGVTQLAFSSASGWQLSTRDGSCQAYDAAVLATPPWISAKLLSELLPPASQALQEFVYEPISTVYLSWPASDAPSLPALQMLPDDPAREHYAQWLFDRGKCGDFHVAAAVISLAGALAEQSSNQQIGAAVARQISSQLQLPAPQATRCITEKRATFVCSANRPVANASTIDGQPLPDGLALAGDYCVHRYPATIESAVISGQQAADHLLL